jgi:hypothetical protein
MHLIQLLLPLHDNDKQAFPTAYFNKVREDLTSRFGGVTAFIRSPAVGLWKENSEATNRDEVIMFEVLTEQLQKNWWADYREQLQERFRQEEILVWASNITKL